MASLKKQNIKYILKKDGYWREYNQVTGELLTNSLVSIEKLNKLISSQVPGTIIEIYEDK